MSAGGPGSDGLHPEARERIARAIHARYLENQRTRKPATDPAMQPWDELAEALKESNRAQAGDIARKLAAIGYRLNATGGPPPLALTGEQVERLAVLEHERWVAERQAAGWTLGPVKDVERRVTPYLVDWAELAEEIREYDREAVREIPALLASAGLKVEPA